MSLQLLTDPRRGQDPSVPDPHHTLETKPLAHLGDLRRQRLGIPGLTGEDLDRDRTAVPVAQQSEDDLEACPSCRPASAQAGPEDRCALRSRWSLRRRAPGCPAQDGAPRGASRSSPGAATASPERCRAGSRRPRRAASSWAKPAERPVGVQTACGGELRGRLEHSSDDHRHDQPALSRGPRRQQTIQAQLAQRPQNRRDVTIGLALDHLEGVSQIFDRGASAQQDTQALDHLWRAAWRDSQGCACGPSCLRGRTRARARRGETCDWGPRRYTWAPILITNTMNVKLLIAINPSLTWVHKSAHQDP